MCFKYQPQFLFVCFHSGRVQRHTACTQLFKKHSHLHGAALKRRELSDIAAGLLVTPSGRGGAKCCVSEQLAAGRSLLFQWAEASGPVCEGGREEGRSTRRRTLRVSDTEMNSSLHECTMLIILIMRRSAGGVGRPPAGGLVGPSQVLAVCMSTGQDAPPQTAPGGSSISRGVDPDLHHDGMAPSSAHSSSSHQFSLQPVQPTSPPLQRQ